MVAANGMYAVFTIESVMAVTEAGKLSKDKKQKERNSQPEKNSLFAQVLNAAIKEEPAPTQFRTVVYGRDGRISSTQYQTREYRY